MRRWTWIIPGLFTLSIAGVALATDYDDVATDLSNNFAAPTVLPLTVGPNTITGRTGSQGGTDLDFFTINVPAYHQLASIKVVSFDGTKSFLGIEKGTVFTDPASTGTANLLGYVHFTSSMVGTDILDDMGAGSGSQHFTGGLSPGDYTFWLQENGTPVVNYQLSLLLAPTPRVPALPAPFGALLCVSLGLGGIALFARARTEPPVG